VLAPLAARAVFDNLLIKTAIFGQYWQFFYQSMGSQKHIDTDLLHPFTTQNKTKFENRFLIELPKLFMSALFAVFSLKTAIFRLNL
jgi:hypothetical protein